MIDRLLRRLAREGVPRLLAGDNPAWVGLALVAYLLRRARRQKAKPVLTFRLQPGHRYLVALNEPRR